MKKVKENKKILQDDTTFKYIFSYSDFAYLFISEFFKFINSDNVININNIVPQNLIFPHKQKGHKYYGDIVIDTNDLIISLEMYQSKFQKNDYNKSYAYKCQLYANQLVNANSKDNNKSKGKKNKSKIDYKNFKKVISINLINSNFLDMNNNLVNKYVFKETSTLKEVDDGNTFLYLIRLDLVKKIPYTENEEKFITLLRLFNAESFNEMTNYVKGDETMKNAIKYVKNWVNDNKEKREYYKRREAEIRADGYEEGSEEANIANAKTMLADGVSVEKVQKYTKLSKAKIMSLL